MTELWRASASEIARLVRARKISAREVADSTLLRLESVNPKINAIVDFRADLVRERADRLDKAIARGDEPGPLAGVPFTVKINLDQSGFANSDGSRLFANRIAQTNDPAVDNLLRAGAIALGRSNSPTFAIRWFTSNVLHGSTRNPRNPQLTPGGSTGGGAAAAATGIGQIAVGTDIGGSVRYPAYACGIHGLRPSVGRIPHHNASAPEVGIGAQLMAVTGPIARTVEDLRMSLHAMSAADPRDPAWMPVPLDGPPRALLAALCPRPAGMQVVREVAAAVQDAGRRLEDAGWTVEEVEETPPFKEAAEVNERLWFGDGFKQFAEAIQQDGDPGAMAVLAGVTPWVGKYPADVFSRALIQRATVIRPWQQFFTKFAVLLVPVSGELAFPQELDLQGASGFQRVWDAQFLMRALPTLGLPGLTVSTGMVGGTPVGVQIIAGRFREDLCLRAGEAIEARGTPSAPIDPRD
jgi:amidase